MPLIESAMTNNSDDLNFIEHALRIPWMVWNASVYEKRGDKKEIYGDYNYLLGEFSLIPEGKDRFNLKIASML
jgi:hypothetical protein